MWATNPLFSIARYYSSSASRCSAIRNSSWQQTSKKEPCVVNTFPLLAAFLSFHSASSFLLLILGGCHLSGSPFESQSLSPPLYDYWKLYGDSASALPGVADAIGWLALHPHSWLAAGSNVRFNQLGGSVCRSVCSDVSLPSLCLSLSVPLLHLLGLANRLLC